MKNWGLPFVSSFLCFLFLPRMLKVCLFSTLAVIWVELTYGKMTMSMMMILSYNPCMTRCSKLYVFVEHGTLGNFRFDPWFDLSAIDICPKLFKRNNVHQRFPSILICRLLIRGLNLLEETICIEVPLTYSMCKLKFPAIALFWISRTQSAVHQGKGIMPEVYFIAQKGWPSPSNSLIIFNCCCLLYFTGGTFSGEKVGSRENDKNTHMQSLPCSDWWGAMDPANWLFGDHT